MGARPGARLWPLLSLTLLVAGLPGAKASTVDDQIDALLARARQESLAGRLTTPPGDNLLETIDTIIKLADHASPDMLPKLAELTHLIDGASTKVSPVKTQAETSVASVPQPATSPLPSMIVTAPGPKWQALFTRGEEAQRLGDISGARRFFEAAASHGHVAAALSLAKLYDPVLLRRMGVVGGITGDPVLAEKWYREAARLGDPGAHELLQALVSR